MTSIKKHTSEINRTLAENKRLKTAHPQDLGLGNGHLTRLCPDCKIPGKQVNAQFRQLPYLGNDASKYEFACSRCYKHWHISAKAMSDKIPEDFRKKYF